MSSPLDLVNQFDSMRQSLSRGPSSIDAYAPQVQVPQFQRPPQPQMPQMPTGGGVMPTAGGKGGFVDFMGERIGADVAPKFAEMHRMFPDLRFTSGGRDDAHNSSVKGVPNSWHLYSNGARAGDWAGSSKTMQNAGAWARQQGAREVLIHNAGSGMHLHVAW